MKKKQIPKLSELASRVALLVDLLAGGSQRAFAKMVGCSHAVIAKILKGQQDPGKEILGRIGQVPQVDQTWLMTGEGEPLVRQISGDDRRVPVADSLLPGPPSEHLHLLSSREEVVPASIYKETLYAVDVAACVPAYDDPQEHFLPGDRLLIDADPKRWVGNIQSLQDKLCVTVLNHSEGPIVTMRRVQVSYSLKHKGWSIFACGDERMHAWIKVKEEMRLEMEQARQYRRVISLGPASQLASSQDFFESIPPTAIVGKAILLLRDL